MATKYGLTGTPKQIDFAFDKRSVMNHRLEIIINGIRSMHSTNEGQQAFNALADSIEKNWANFKGHYTDATVWIEQSEYLLGQCVTGTVSRSKNEYVVKYASDIVNTAQKVGKWS